MRLAITFDILKLRLMYEKRCRMCPSRILRLSHGAIFENVQIGSV